MNRYVYPALMLLCFFLTVLTLPYGQPFAPFSPSWYAADLFFIAMVIFCGLWMWDGRW